MCFIGICILSFYLFCHSLFNRVYLSSMLFCACSSVTIAIGIINAYMLVLCLYMCIYMVCVAVPCCHGQVIGP